jgi:hypothetical protein
MASVIPLQPFAVALDFAEKPFPLFGSRHRAPASTWNPEGVMRRYRNRLIQPGADEGRQFHARTVVIEMKPCVLGND